MLLAELLYRQSIRVLWKLVAFTFKAQYLKLKVGKLRKNTAVIAHGLFENAEREKSIRKTYQKILTGIEVGILVCGPGISASSTFASQILV